jgi:phosphohistidine phosphatase
MELVLWRHAEAEVGEPDLGRKLTPKGEKQARRMAEWLQSHLPDTAKIYVSPATRAQQTALALAEISLQKIRTVNEIGPGATAAELLTAVGWPDSQATIVVVGHQPTLGRIASVLLAGQVQDWPIKKAGVWWFSQRERGGEAQTVLRAVVNPDFA